MQFLTNSLQFNQQVFLIYIMLGINCFVSGLSLKSIPFIVSNTVIELLSISELINFL